MPLPDYKKTPFNISKTLNDFIQKFDLEVVNIEYKNGYEIHDGILYIWGFNATSEDMQICELLKQNPNTNTLYIGKGVTDRNDLRKIHHILTSSHNTIPVIKHIIVEDNSRFCSVDGLLIDKTTMTVKDYASGRDNETIIIPNAVVGLDEHCFNYNEYVKNLILPPSIKKFDGITSLPKLESVNFNNGTDFFSENGIIFSSIYNTPFFISPFSPMYPNTDELKVMFGKIYHLVKTEAENDRWQGVTPDNISIESYDNNDIYISYYGGYYRQYWRLYRQPLPTRFIFEYSFYEEWNVKCASRLIREGGIDEETTLVHLKCHECIYNDICDGVYKSNDIYMSKTINRLNTSGIAYFKPAGKTGFNCELSIDSPIEACSHTLLIFLDIALEHRLKYPILRLPIHNSLFTDSDIETTPSKDSPFNSSYPPLGFISETFTDIGQDDSVPPF